jgi:hypothetical protein
MLRNLGDRGAVQHGQQSDGGLVRVLLLGVRGPAPDQVPLAGGV